MITTLIINANSPLTAKIACSTFQRVLTIANIHCWKSEVKPLFRLARSSYFEYCSEINNYFINADFLTLVYGNSEFKTSGINVFTDSSIIALRNPDHLWSNLNGSLHNLQYLEDRKALLRDSSLAALFTKNELAAYGHRYVSSPGIFSIQSVCLPRLTEVWRKAQALGKDLDEAIREKAVWNKTLVMLAGEMKQKPFERGEVIPVREGEIDWDEVRNACIVSVSDWKDEKAKEHFLRCLYFGHFFGDETGLMLNILDP